MPGDKKHRLAYLCLQSIQEGQASYAHVNEIVKGLRKRGWQVELFAPDYGSTMSCSILGRLFGTGSVQLRLWFGGKHIDALYVRTHYAAFPTVLWAKLRHIPVVQELNGPYEDVFIAWPWMRRAATLIKWSMRTQMRWADAVITVTPQLKQWIAREGVQKPIFVIPNGANTDLFKPNVQATRDLPEPYAVFFGALARWQGIDVLLKAAQCPEWPSGLNLVIAGDGTERAHVFSSAKDNPHIVYLGRLPYREMPEIVSHSVMGISPKSNLGERSSTGLFPLKLFETMACGVPVIVTDFPGQSELVRQGQCGLVIPPDDAQALAEAVSRLFNHAEEAKMMGERGRQMIEQAHSWDARSEETHQVLIEVLLGKER